MSTDPNYKVIELQAENENLKDKLIESLYTRISRLEEEVSYLKGLVSPKDIERDVGSNMIVPANFKIKPHIRTVSEISTILERKSLNSVELKKSAEDIKGEA